MTGLLIQEFKTLIKSPASISILVIPLVLLIGLGYLLPSGWIVPSSITIGIVAAVLLYFGGSIEEIKRTSFMKSISLTRLSKFTFLATKILFAMIVSMVSVLWVLLFSWIFTATSIAFLATDFSHLLGNVDGALGVVSKLPFNIQWQNVQWFKMLYAGVVTIVVAVSLSFIFVAFAKSSLSFYLMSFGYLLAMILFGGVVMPGFLISSDNSWFKNLYYIVPNFYTNNIMASAFSGGILPSMINSITYDVLDPALAPIFDAAQATNSDLQVILGNEDVYNFVNLLIKGDIGGTSKLINSVTGVEITFKDANVTDVASLITYVNENGIDTISYKSGLGGFTVISTSFIPSLENLFIGEHWDYAEKILGLKIDISVPGFIPIVGGLSVHIHSVFLQNWFNSGHSIVIVNSIVDSIGNHSEQIDGLLNLLAQNGFINPSLVQTIETLVPTVSTMFGDLDWWNWPVPWLEGTLFLLISIKFFKWS